MAQFETTVKTCNATDCAHNSAKICDLLEIEQDETAGCTQYDPQVMEEEDGSEG